MMPNTIQLQDRLKNFKGWWHGRYRIHYVLNADGNLNVPYLNCNVDKPYVNWNNLDNRWNDNEPALVSANLFISLLLLWESFVFKLQIVDFLS